jgi:hypothetical protein
VFGNIQEFPEFAFQCLVTLWKTSQRKVIYITFPVNLFFALYLRKVYYASLSRNTLSAPSLTLVSFPHSRLFLCPLSQLNRKLFSSSALSLTQPSLSIENSSLPQPSLSTQSSSLKSQLNRSIFSQLNLPNSSSESSSSVLSSSESESSSSILTSATQSPQSSLLRSVPFLLIFSIY